MICVGSEDVVWQWDKFKEYAEEISSPNPKLLRYPAVKHNYDERAGFAPKMQKSPDPFHVNVGEATHIILFRGRDRWMSRGIDSFVGPSGISRFGVPKVTVMCEGRFTHAKLQELVGKSTPLN